MQSIASPSPYNKDNPFPARILENRPLSKAGSDKDTRHFVLSLAGSGIEYEAGDSLGVYPINPPGEVDEVLKRLGASGQERVTLPRATVPVPLRLALFANVALDGPTRKILETLATKATDATERARLASLLEPDATEGLKDYLGKRHYADVLGDFPSARLAPQEFVDHLRRLAPRLYSIASSPKKHPGEVHLTVVVVRYHMNGRDRVGVCSSFLADRVKEIETLVPVFLAESHFRPPADGARDCIMIGPGTGIAPFRAFVEERAATGAPGRNWIFFGDQHEATDFLYEDEWEDALASGRLHRLDTAWSRDQERKIYVQDRLRENAVEVWRWLEGGAHVYVCGDAKRMAKDVDAVLHEIVAKEGGLTAEGAAEYVKRLKKERRYQRDVY